MKIGKSVGLDDISIEVRKFVGARGFVWLSKLFGNIKKPKRMPDEYIKKYFSADI